MTDELPTETEINFRFCCGVEHEPREHYCSACQSILLHPDVKICNCANCCRLLIAGNQRTMRAVKFGKSMPPEVYRFVIDRDIRDARGKPHMRPYCRECFIDRMEDGKFLRSELTAEPADD